MDKAQLKADCEQEAALLVKRFAWPESDRILLAIELQNFITALWLAEQQPALRLVNRNSRADQ